MLSKEELLKLNQIDITTVDKNELQELTEIHIDSTLNIEERLETFLTDIKNPYYFKVNGTPVKIGFSNNEKTLNGCLIHHFNNHYKEGFL